jgi:curli biogenesis system outer membrane secretion channel CsgG
LGTVSVIEDQESPWFYSLMHEHHLGSTVPVLKLLVQQSNCFVVVDRGRGLDAAMKERSLNQSGETRKGSKMHKGQMVAADYTISPTITFSNSDAGGVGAGLIGIFSPIAGGLAGAVSSKEASTLLTLVDNRSSVQLAAAEGSAKNMDFGGVGALFGGGLGGGLGGYANTAQGKVIVAAFTDSFNNLVKSLREYKAQDVEGGMGKGGKLKVN